MGLFCFFLTQDILSMMLFTKSFFFLFACMCVSQFIKILTPLKYFKNIFFICDKNDPSKRRNFSQKNTKSKKRNDTIQMMLFDVIHLYL